MKFHTIYIIFPVIVINDEKKTKENDYAKMIIMLVYMIFKDYYSDYHYENFIIDYEKNYFEQIEDKYAKIIVILVFKNYNYCDNVKIDIYNNYVIIIIMNITLLMMKNRQIWLKWRYLCENNRNLRKKKRLLIL